MSSDANEVRCRAITAAHDMPDNILFTPPCDCPRCVSAAVYDRNASGRSAHAGWLRLSGHRQRYRVEVVELGATGRAVLGSDD